ncbi:Putative transposon Tn552 DNA-invertase bin3 [Paenibacillus polymyxa E681]|uniref:recombinase family protein n=1 Tax=Paenibacillus polymyxa TaxID=1406 RepID=UPI0001E317AE|nr:recombinase family protein [Paenibacillus polymyxa]ADM69364.1 recombinase [Paenibacillus polymyxa E681]QNV56376.1 Putative transposon Tn552 DNA-invertase bin3 [Paenibacillus polymyxa E681]QNV61213.1 Putative transposon Tn552 DNA-invertase bin3 [Paenibacillus polymyxa E681]
MKLAYGRVSAKDQNPERQLVKFRELKIDERYIFVDKLSGKNFNRPRYQAMRLMIREGDLIYIDALDRLGRDYDGIIDEWKYITREVGADIVCLDNETLFDSRKFKTMGDLGKLLEDQFLSMLAYVAAQERLKNKQRQSEGIEVAKAAGVKFGRPKQEITAEFARVYDKWKSGAIKAVEAMKELGMKNRTFYRRVKEYEQQKQVG